MCVRLSVCDHGLTGCPLTNYTRKICHGNVFVCFIDDCEDTRGFGSFDFLYLVLRLADLDLWEIL